jgi:hypothetical protein
MEIRETCPFCNKPNHLYINTLKEVFYCQRCKKSGHIRKLATSIIIPQDVEKKEKKNKLLLNRKLIKQLTPESNKKFYSYIKSRKAVPFRDNLFTHEDYPGYVIIGLPLLVPHNKLNFFFGRKIMFGGPRYYYYRSTKGIIAKSFIGKVPQCLIVEGFFDLCSTAEFIPTIASMGKDPYDDKKIDEIVNSTDSAIITLDVDAMEESIIMSSKLEERGVKTHILHTHIFKDPGDNSDWIRNKLERLR